MNTTDLVLSNESFFKNALCENEVKWEQESQFAIQALSNEYCANAVMSNPASLQNAIINVAAVGISLNPALKHAYLVPRAVKKGQAPVICLDISYMGLLHIAMQSGSIKWGQAKIVYANDTYINNGIDKAPTHNQDTFSKDKGPVIGVYCTVKTPDGDYLTEEMDVDALHKVEASSKAANGPWKTWREEMQRKTVVKRASKYWPKIERLSHAIEALNYHEGLDDLTPTAHEREINIEYQGQDMRLEGVPDASALEPKKRIDKELMQKSLTALVQNLNDDDESGIYETWTELDEQEKTHLWRQFNSKQQKRIREVSEKNKRAA
tara:strand:+ start:112 stop:1077 length:966 start_codon:yes stop_codon:yes gene_type:complete